MPSSPEENSSQAVVSIDARVAGWMTYREPRGSKFTTLTNLPITMRGRHQAANAATAIAAIHRLVDAGWAFSEQQIRTGLAVAQCAARVEIVSEAPTVVLDVAHNVASIQALLESIPPKRYRHRAIVFAASQDKDIAGMLDQIVTHFDTLIFTRFTKNARAADPNELANDARKRKMARGIQTPDILVCDTPDESWARARGLAGPDDLICVTGSFFLVAELSDRVRGRC
jgi:dihydrofolate synthase/folylpolyglutamate synthase